MTQTLARQPWMDAPGPRTVIAALEKAGGEGCARYVGGCVRDALIGRSVSDIDIATVLTPPQTTAALVAAGLKAVPTGIDHGTITAVAFGKPFEVTTLRRDVETDGRRAVVAFTEDWAEDAGRRDFRLNALYLDGHGRLYDPTGGGIDDAQAGRIIFVGDPETRIREDYLRVLRFYRFLAWFGRGAPDPAALAACARWKDGVAGLSGERVSKEILKLLAADDPAPSLRLMVEAGVLALLLPEARRLDRLDGLIAVERGLGETEPELRLAALFPDEPKAFAPSAARLRLSNAQAARIAAALGGSSEISAVMTPHGARAAIYRLGARTFRDRLKLAWAARPADDPAPWRALIQIAETWTPPTLPVNGVDAQAAGAAHGPAVGRALAAVENWWIEHDFAPDRAALLQRLGLEARN